MLKYLIKGRAVKTQHTLKLQFRVFTFTFKSLVKLLVVRL